MKNHSLLLLCVALIVGGCSIGAKTPESPVTGELMSPLVPPEKEPNTEPTPMEKWKNSQEWDADFRAEQIANEEAWDSRVKHITKDGTVGTDGLIEGSFYAFKLRFPEHWGEVSYSATTNDPSEAGPYPSELGYMMPRERFDISSSEGVSKEFRVEIYDKKYFDEYAGVADGASGQDIFYHDDRFWIMSWARGRVPAFPPTSRCDPLADDYEDQLKDDPVCLQAEKDIRDLYDVITPTFELIGEL